MAVDRRVFELVAVGEQAVVAGAFAVVGSPVTAAEVLAGVGVEVGDLQRGAGGDRDGVRFGLQAAQDAGATLGGLGEQHAPAVLVIGQGLAGQLGIIQLERRLDAALQGVAQGGRDLVGHGVRQPHYQDVAPVLDIGNNADRPLVIGAGVAVVGLGLGAGLVGQPLALDGVEVEADLAGILAAAASAVGDPYLGRVAVGQFRQGRPIGGDLADQLAGA